MQIFIQRSSLTTVLYLVQVQDLNSKEERKSNDLQANVPVLIGYMPELSQKYSGLRITSAISKMLQQQFTITALFCNKHTEETNGAAESSLKRTQLSRFANS